MDVGQRLSGAAVADGLDIAWLTTADGLPDNSVSSVAFDSKGFLWIATLNGVSRYDGYTFAKFSKQRGRVSLAGNRSKQIYIGKDGLVWITSAVDKVSCFDPQQGCFVEYAGSDSYSAWSHVRPDSGGTWVWNKDTALYVERSAGGLSFKKMPKAKAAIPQDMKNHDELVLSIQQTGGFLSNKASKRFSVVDAGNGTAWVSTNGNGLFLVDKHSGAIIRHITKTSSGGRLKSDNILCMIADGHGGLWVGTEYMGLGHLRMRRKPSVLVAPFDGVHPDANHIRMIHGDGRGNILVANSDGRMVRLDADFKAVGRPSRFPANVSCMALGPKYEYIGIREYGLLVGGKAFRHDDSDSLSLSNRSVFSMLRDRRGRLWVGTLGGGLNLAVDDGKGGYNFDMVFGDSYANKRIRCLCEDKNGMIWIGTSNGLYIFNPDEVGKSKVAWHHYGYEDGSMESNEIRCIRQMSDGSVFIAETGAGFAVTKPSGSYGKLSFRHYGVSEGLVNAMTMAIEEDRYGNVWISTEGGMSCFSPKTSTFLLSMGGGNGQSVYCENCSWRMADGRLLFGTHEGLSVIKPERQAKAADTRSVKFTGMSVNGTGDSRLSLSLAYRDNVELAYNENSIAVSFSTLDFSQGSYRYSYWLENYDKHWSKATTSPNATYRNLPPGRYRLHVVAVSATGGRSKESFLDITISQPFWNSAWAWVLYAVAVGFLGWFVVCQLRRTYKLRWQMKVAGELSEYKDSFFMNISHEFRTPITLILASVEQMETEIPANTKTGRAVQMLGRNANKLLTLVNELLEVRKAEDGKMPVNIGPTDISMLCQRKTAAFKDLVNSKNITLETDIDMGGVWINTDEDKIDKILNNLLSNAIKYTPYGGKVSLGVCRDERSGTVEITVADTGIGVSEDKRPMLFSRFATLSSRSGGIGIGLYFTRQLALALGGDISFRPNTGGGSVFSVWIKAEAVDRCAATVSAVCCDTSESNMADGVPPLNEHTVLVIDDDFDMRSVLCDALAPYVKVHAVESGERGLEYASSNDVDLVLCDVMMEGMNGFDVVKRIKADFKTCHLPVILITALNNDDSRMGGAECGADDYITKPFSTKYVITRVLKLIEQRNALKEKFSKDLSVKRPVISKTEIDKAFIDKLEAVMEREMGNDAFTVDELAADMLMGRTAFYHKVKGVTGCGPKTYMRIMRMKKAAELLSTTDKLVSEIAYTVGFSDPLYFSKAFKAQFGKSPSDYQKELLAADGATE